MNICREQGAREVNHKRLLNTENRLRVAGGVVGGGRARRVMGTEEGTCWHAHWVSYVRHDHWVLLRKPILHGMLTNLDLNKNLGGQVNIGVPGWLRWWSM